MLAVAGGKGGCGKTTVTLGLAAAYGRQRRRALAVDADVDMPNLHLAGGVPDAPPLDRASAPDAAAIAARGPDLPNVGVLAAPADGRVGAGLDALPRDRPVLVDCPAGAARPAVVPLRRADAALVVTTPHPPCVTDALKTAAVARAVGTPLAGAVLNRAGRGRAGVGDAFDAPVLARVPDVSRPLADRAASAAFDRLATALGPNP